MKFGTKKQQHAPLPGALHVQRTKSEIREYADKQAVLESRLAEKSGEIAAAKDQLKTEEQSLVTANAKLINGRLSEAEFTKQRKLCSTLREKIEDNQVVYDTLEDEKNKIDHQIEDLQERLKLHQQTFNRQVSEKIIERIQGNTELVDLLLSWKVACLHANRPNLIEMDFWRLLWPGGTPPAEERQRIAQEINEKYLNMEA